MSVGGAALAALMLMGGVLGIPYLIGIGVRGAWRYFRGRRTNRYRRGFLPAPDPRCIPGANWKAHAQQGRFG